ncbi:nucleotidyltransferase domain-containing protein [Cellulomonas cellasea]|uniref:nucleotidyltransferase domain-containing protein n=1 Tax=Cellulomonas cellasea TaxID=43670 RepID=UPI0025A35126|nr:nucleotidyltransferase domain-containing protein [Cellulomonas cellasea]MDM8085081.1 nucleotidyltransferase domain-containing protein [Cellulomonas cellasea]
MTATRVGGSVLYDLNRAHLTFPAIDAAFQHLDPWHELRSRTAGVIDLHYPDPDLAATVSVAVFGSVARGDADLESDMDLLVVTPLLDENAQAFADDLALQARRWTGQDVQIYLTTSAHLADARVAGDPIIDTLRADARPLAGQDVTPLLAAS